MTRIQKFFKTVLPNSWAESMEKESREWLMKCLDCGLEQSVWEAGGIRWKASGRKQTKSYCEKCDFLTWHEIYRKSSFK
jgi:hypothetical protein